MRTAGHEGGISRVEGKSALLVVDEGSLWIGSVEGVYKEVMIRG